MPSLGIWEQSDSASLQPTAPIELPSPLSNAQQREQAREDRFLAWQIRWADMKGQLFRRLDVIDEQLARFTDSKRTSPQLTIVGTDDFDEA